MKKSVLLGGLFVLLCGVVWANIAINRQKLPDFVPDSMNEKIANTVDQLISAIAEKNVKSLKKVWQIPSDQKIARECIHQIKTCGKSKFDLHGAFFADKDHKRISVTGMMIPSGNMVSLVMEKQDDFLRIVEFSVN